MSLVTDTEVTFVTGWMCRASHLVEFGQVDWVGLGCAIATPDGILDHQSPSNRSRLVKLKDVGAGLDMIFANRSSTKPADGDGGPLAMPAVHEESLPSRCRANAAMFDSIRAWQAPPA